MSDRCYLVIGRFKGNEQVWRAGVFDSEEEAEDSFAVFFAYEDHPPEFVRTMLIELQ